MTTRRIQALILLIVVLALACAIAYFQHLSMASYVAAGQVTVSPWWHMLFTPLPFLVWGFGSFSAGMLAFTSDPLESAP